MKNEVARIFNYEDKKVNVVLIDGQVWFKVADIATILEYTRTESAIYHLDDDEKLIQNISVSSRKIDAWFVNESGLYNLILKSTKSEAKVFRKWVTAEILPSVRKAGSYSTTEARNYHENLNFFVSKIEELKNEKETVQQKLNNLKKEIEHETNKMINFIKIDQNQIKIEFID